MQAQGRVRAILLLPISKLDSQGLDKPQARSCPRPAPLARFGSLAPQRTVDLIAKMSLRQECSSLSILKEFEAKVQGLMWD